MRRDTHADKATLSKGKTENGNQSECEAGNDSGQKGPKNGTFWNDLQEITTKEGPNKNHKQRRAERKHAPRPWRQPAFVPSQNK
jgi:hypothetical protein